MRTYEMPKTLLEPGDAAKMFGETTSKARTMLRGLEFARTPRGTRLYLPEVVERVQREQVAA